MLEYNLYVDYETSDDESEASESIDSNGSDNDGLSAISDESFSDSRVFYASYMQLNEGVKVSNDTRVLICDKKTKVVEQITFDELIVRLGDQFDTISHLPEETISKLFDPDLKPSSDINAIRSLFEENSELSLETISKNLLVLNKKGVSHKTYCILKNKFFPTTVLTYNPVAPVPELYKIPSQLRNSDMENKIWFVSYNAGHLLKQNRKNSVDYFAECSFALQRIQVFFLFIKLCFIFILCHTGSQFFIFFNKRIL